MLNSTDSKSTVRKLIPEWRFRLRWVVWFRITAPFRAIARFLSRIFTVYRVAFILLIIASSLWYFSRISVDELLPNFITDLFAVALTVFIIDTMYRVRSDSEQKKVLISKLGSKNNSVSSEAVHELKARGWLSDGSLQKAFLISANLDNNSFTGASLRQAVFSFASLKNTKWFEADLEGAFLDNVDLQGASLSTHAIGPHYAEADLANATFTNANLAGASVRNEQLCKARSLWRAVMPNGKIYDGRYNFTDDINLHLEFARDPTDPIEWAQFYGVSVDQYLEGQRWSKSHPELSQSQVNQTGT